MNKAVMILIFISLFMISQAQASDFYKYREENTYTLDFDITYIGKYAIVSVYLNDITNFNSKQQLVLDAYGQQYLITIVSQSSGLGDAWKTFNITLTYPNGTTVTKTVSPFTPQPFAQDYDVRIQYWVIQYDTPTSGVDIDIYVGGLFDFDPVIAEGMSGAYVQFNLSKFVLFNRVHLNSTAPLNAEVFYVDKNGWKQIVNMSKSPYYSPPVDEGAVTELIWSKILELISNIPVVGEYIVTALDVMGRVVGEVFFYINLLFIENWEITALIFESFAMMYSIQSRSLTGILYRYMNFHITAFQIMFIIIVDVLSLLFRLISAIGSLIPFT